MKKQQKYSWEERELAIELWRESGLSQTAFCKREGIARSTFQHWMERSEGKKRYKPKKTKGKNQGKFIPLSIKSSTTSTLRNLSTDSIELTYPNGVCLKLSSGLSMEQLRQYISLV